MTLPVRSGTGYCAARWCNNSKSKHPNLSFFRFPKDEERCKAWLKYSKRDDLVDLSPDQLYSGYRLCSRHFDKTQYMTVFKKGKLVKAACPNVEEGHVSPIRGSSQSPKHGKTARNVTTKVENSSGSSQSPEHGKTARNVTTKVENSSDVSSESISVEKESNISSSSNVTSLLLECETASSDIIPVPQKSYLAVNSDIVTLLLECESEPYVS